MGYNATVVVLVDRLDEIEKDPEFGKKLVTAIRYYSRVHPDRMPYVTGQTQVVEVEHADMMQIVAIGGNTGRTLGWGSYRDDDDRLIDGLVEQRKRKRGKMIIPQPALPADYTGDKFYRTTFTYEVLSDQPLPDRLDLSMLQDMTFEGDCVGRFGNTTEVVLTAKQAADALYEFGSEPAMFMLDDAGHRVDENGHRVFDHDITVEEEDDGFVVCIAGRVQLGASFADRSTAEDHAEMLQDTKKR